MPLNKITHQLETKEETLEAIETLCLHEKLRLCPFYWRVLAFMVDILLVGFLLSDILSLCDFLHVFKWTLNPIYYTLFIGGCFIILHSLYEMFFLFFLGASLGKVIFRIKIINLYLADTPNKSVLFKRLGLKHMVFLCPLIALFYWDSLYHRAWHEQKTKTLLALF
ncbi:RDD family protein [Helicobacter cetorum]|uniref:RDD family protein n=1 Tax=Helicobacter cetorum TaxID=138563 RepID=UPI000CF05D5C|nr:RDD family protein [Helicobacter cetorum]